MLFYLNLSEKLGINNANSLILLAQKTVSYFANMLLKSEYKQCLDWVESPINLLNVK